MSQCKLIYADSYQILFNFKKILLEKFMFRYQFSLILFCVLFFVSGCNNDSSRPSDLPPLFSCTITVLQDEKPLDGAMVFLVPIDASGSKYQASSITDEQGIAAISTYGFAGVPAGQYKVTIMKTIEDDLVYGKDAYGDDTVTDSTTYHLVDTKFSSAESSPYEIEITGKGKAKLTADVGKAIKTKVKL
jgi:hypothetical protein